jgi:hypothetical protein
MTSTIKVNNIQNQCGANIINENSNTITLGASGDTIALASGASQSGFGRTGTVDWQTTKKTTAFTAVNGEGYFVDTAASGAVTMTLPSSPSAGNIVAVKDYNGNFGTANLTIGRGGSAINGGSSVDPVIDTDGASIVLVYVDGTQGWVATQDDSSNIAGAAFVTATGGDAIVTCGNFKTHIFTGPGTFAVSQVASNTPENTVDYLVVAGGGGAGGDGGGAGGAGGMRFFSTAPGCNSPINNSGASPNTEITVTATSYPIAVGGGGAGVGPGNAPAGLASAGVASTFSTVTSAGGGRGGAYNSGGSCANLGGTGGSGGGHRRGAAKPTAAAAGNTPPVAPSQGNPGGLYNLPQDNASSGGGGAGAAGDSAVCQSISPGGIGAYIAVPFIGPTAPSYGTPGPVSATRYFAGGGTGGATNVPGTPTVTPGVAGGGGTGYAGDPASNPNPSGANSNGVVNTGGGASSGGNDCGGGTGGSGVVMIRYKFQ